jgi:hypothetical protein
LFEISTREPTTVGASPLCDKDAFQETSGFVKNLDSVGAPIADVNQTIIAENNTVDDFQKDASYTRVNLGLCPLPSPLA